MRRLGRWPGATGEPFRGDVGWGRIGAALLRSGALDPMSAAAESSSSAPRRGASGSLVLYLGFLALLAEVGAYLAFAALAGELYSAAKVREQQEWSANLMGRRGNVPAPARGPTFLRGEAVHPYIGFLQVPVKRNALDDGWGLNEDGLYQPDSPLFERGPETLLVGITGGSVAALFIRESRDVLVRELQRDPRFAGRQVRFVSMAAGGFKAPQQLMATTYLLALGGSLDLLINIDGFNEVRPARVGQRAAARLPRLPALVVLPGAPRPADAAARRRDRVHAAPARAGGPRGPRVAAALLLDPQALVEGARQALPRAPARARDRPAQLQADRRAGHPGRSQARVRRPGPSSTTSLRASGPRARSSCTGCARPTASATSTCCNRTSTSRAPSPSPTRSSARRSTRPRTTPRGARLGYPRLLAAGEELVAEGVRFFDATRVFEGIEDTLYVDDCCHFNERGNDLLAEAIARFVSESH